jgi:hypothetical protein
MSPQQFHVARKAKTTPAGCLQLLSTTRATACMKRNVSDARFKCEIVHDDGAKGMNAYWSDRLVTHGLLYLRFFSGNSVLQRVALIFYLLAIDKLIASWKFNSSVSDIDFLYTCKR